MHSKSPAPPLTEERITFCALPSIDTLVIVVVPASILQPASSNSGVASRMAVRIGISLRVSRWRGQHERMVRPGGALVTCCGRSEEHTSELQSLMRISYAVFCLKKNNKDKVKHNASYTTHQK